MAYLEVVLENTLNGKPLAVTANVVSLGRKNGCMWFFLGPDYPLAESYVRGLEREGWRLYNSTNTSAMGIIYGMPFASNTTKLVFVGDGRYQIEWRGDGWCFKEHRKYMTEEYELDGYNDELFMG